MLSYPQAWCNLRRITLGNQEAVHSGRFLGCCRRSFHDSLTQGGSERVDYCLAEIDNSCFPQTEHLLPQTVLLVAMPVLAGSALQPLVPWLAHFGLTTRLPTFLPDGAW